MSTPTAECSMRASQVHTEFSRTRNRQAVSKTDLVKPLIMIKQGFWKLLRWVVSAVQPSRGAHFTGEFRAGFPRSCTTVPWHLAISGGRSWVPQSFQRANSESLRPESNNWAMRLSNDGNLMGSRKYKLLKNSSESNYFVSCEIRVSEQLHDQSVLNAFTGKLLRQQLLDLFSLHVGDFLAETGRAFPVWIALPTLESAWIVSTRKCWHSSSDYW